MSRATQYINFLNSEKLPTPFERINMYSDLTITKEMIAERLKYQNELRQFKHQTKEPTTL